MRVAHKLVAIALAAASMLALGGCAGSLPPAEPALIAKSSTLFIGDSYTHGRGASQAPDRWTSLVSAAEGWHEHNVGRGGSGYVASAKKGGCSLVHCDIYTKVIRRNVYMHPDRVVIAGGQNDLPAFKSDPKMVLDAIDETFALARATFPNAEIIAIGPSNLTDADPGRVAIDAEVQRAAALVDARYVSLLNPLVITSKWELTGDGHVNDYGHAAIAARVIAALADSRVLTASGH